LSAIVTEEMIMKNQVAHTEGSLRFRRKPLISALEPRLLLDGAAVATAVDLTTDITYQEQAADSAPHAAQATAPVAESAAAVAPTSPLSAASTPATEGALDETADVPGPVQVALAEQPSDGTPGDAGPSAAPINSSDLEAGDVAETDLVADAAAPSATRRETVFVDAQVESYQTLVDGLGEGVEVHLIDSASNGLEQIAAVLQGQSGIDAIHVYSHGDVGQLTLGNLTLNSDNLGQYSELLAQIGQSLSEDADMMLYGCYVGADSEGRNFIDELAQLTGADVAASNDLTGSDSHGGNWDLEVSAGQIESAAIPVGSYANVLATPVISQLSDFSYIEDSGAVQIDENISISGATDFRSGYIEFSLGGATTSETLGIVTSGSASTAAGVISIVGSTVYRGTGSASEIIGSVDPTYNGLNGQSLRINFSNAFENGSFQTGNNGDTVITGWTSVEGRIRLDGVYQIAGQATPVDSTYPAQNTTGDYSTGGTFTQTTNLSNYAADFAGDLALELNTGASSISQPYGVIRGPAVYSNGTVSLQAGDQVSFDWKALSGGDAYDAYGYLVDVNNGRTITILDATGTSANQESAWATNTSTIAAGYDGVYRFVFVAGSFDLTGGNYLGGRLLIDDVTVTQANPPGAVTSADMSTISRLVTYQNTDQDFASTSRTLTVVAVDGSGDPAGSASSTITLVRVNDAPTLTGGATLSPVPEDSANPAGATVASLFSSRFSDVDSTNAPYDTLAGIAVSSDASTADQGTWQYSTDGSNWYGIDSVSTGNALLLSSSTSVRFVPSADWNGTPGGLSVHAVDSSYGGSFTSGASRSTFDTTSDGPASAVSASAVSLTTSVTAVNDAPTLTGAPSDLNVIEDVASDVDLSAVVLTDIDSTGADFTLTLTVGAGTLAASSGGGVTVSGSGSGVVTLTGTASNIDTYLNTASNIKYTGELNANGDNATTLTLTANDQDGSGNVVLGTINVDIAAVNDLPTITGVAGATVNEDESLSINGFTIEDVDGDTVRIRVESTNGSLSLGTSTGTSVHSTGSTLEFSGSVADAGSALNTLQYQPDANFNGTDDLSVQISDDNGATWQIYTVAQQGMFFNPSNGHYYQYVSAPGITWDDARDAAAASTLYGLNGYLMTVTSAEENAFITPRLGGDGWMGASDASSEGIWTWVTGPEAGTQFWTGDTSAGTNPTGNPGTAYNGAYANWVTGEPNNSDLMRGGEDVAHFYAGTGFWNDFAATNYNIDGYVVEYGGAGFGSLQAAPLTITVNSVNDAPVFTSAAVTVSLSDTSAADTFATQTGSLAASDDHGGAPNEGGTLTYGISGGTSGPTTVSQAGTFGTLTVTMASGAYSFVPDANAINMLPSGAGLNESFTVTVSDGQGGTTTQVFTVDVTPANDRPVGVDDTASVVEAGGTANGVAGTSASGNVLANDTDIDSTDIPVVNGAVVAVRETTAGSDTSVDAGTNSSDGRVVTGLYGSLHIGADGSYQYVTDESNAAVQGLRTTGQTLTERFTYTLADSGGLTDEAVLTVTIDGRNDAPVAADDHPVAVESGGVFNATPGSNASGNVLSNDTDPDSVANGETQTVTAIRTGTESGSGSFGSVGAVLVGTYGSLTLNDDGEFTYVIDDTNAAVQALRISTQTLTDNFTYTVTDTAGLTDSATLAITIEGRNDNPVAVDDVATAIESGDRFNSTAGTDASGNVLTNDSDVDGVANGETRTVSAVRTGPEAGSGSSGTVGLALAGAYGHLTLNSDGSYTYAIDDTNPSVQALRVSGQTLTDSFTYTVADTGGLTDQATLTITIDGRNDRPVANDDVATAVEAGGVANRTPGSNATGNVLDNDTDVDSAAGGETATVIGVRTGDEGGGGRPGVVGGALTGSYGRLTLNADGSFTYVVDNDNAAVEALRVGGQTLTDSFTYTVTDAGGLTDEATLTITIQGQNDAPVVDLVNIDQTWDFGKPFSLDVSSYFSDVDSASNGEAFRFSVTGLPSGMFLDPNTGRITGSPSGIGTFHVTLTVSDREGLSVSRQFVFEVLPPPVQEPPQATPMGPVVEPLPVPDALGLDSTPVTGEMTPLPDGTIGTGLAADPAQEVGYLSGGQSWVDALVGQTQEPFSTGRDGETEGPAEPDPATRGNPDGAERVVLEEGSTRVIEYVNPDGNVTSIRGMVRVDVGADGLVLFSEGQQRVFDIVGLSVASINGSEGGLTILVADEGRGRDTQFYVGEMGDGSKLPAWIKVDQATGEVTIDNPPPGTDEVTVRVKAVSSDGSMRMLDIELKLSDLLKRKQEGAPQDGEEEPVPVGFVPFDAQVVAEVSSHDAYGQRLMALLNDV